MLLMSPSSTAPRAQEPGSSKREQRLFTPFKSSGLGASTMWVLLSLSLVSCNESATGLYKTQATEGPSVLFDFEARPLPEIPFPNNLATRYDPQSKTGRRLNISVLGPTALEGDVRQKANRLDGFGLFSPITVSFSDTIDVADLRARHLDQDRANDAVFLINISPESPGYGEAIDLDIGYYAELPEERRLTDDQRGARSGRFPTLLDERDRYFPYDSKNTSHTLVVESMTELDHNNNGKLDDDEDLDGDEVWDQPNTIDGEEPPASTLEAVDRVITFYEYETNTLIIRTVRPLRAGTTYALVLSNRVRGVNKAPIHSPFDYVNHSQQTQELEPLKGQLERHGLKGSDIAFTWSFTTQSATDELLSIRRGLRGLGVFSQLQSAYPPEIDEIWNWFTEESINECTERPRGVANELGCTPSAGIHILEVERIVSVLTLLATLLVGEGGALVESYEFVDYFVAGQFYAPYFMGDRDGLAEGDYPQDDDESIEVDTTTGAMIHEPARVTFWCAIPKPTRGRDLEGNVVEYKAPFPVVFYGHGYGAARFEMLGFAGNHARFGLATCATDAVGHGLPVIGMVKDTLDQVGGNIVKGLGLNFEAMIGNITRGRARDLNNDGIPDVGGDFWTADTFHTRDNVRQSAIDWLQLVRILQGFDGERKMTVNGEEIIAGDFNKDGVVDLGGPDADFFGWGQSLGGIMSVLAPAVEPAIVATAPTAGGAGLVDIAVRSSNPGVPEAVLLRMMGPLIIGDPVYEGRENPVPEEEQDGEGVTSRWRISWMVPETSPPLATPVAQRVFVKEVELKDGDLFVVRNLTRERRTDIAEPERRFTVVRAGKGFRVQFAADAWSSSERRGRLKFDPREEDFQGYKLSESELNQIGDHFIFEIYDPDQLDQPKMVIDQWSEDVLFEGVIYPSGGRLVAPSPGFGLLRQSPALRRFYGIAQAILDSGDPASYARHYFEEPFDQRDTNPDHPMETRALVVVSNGDQSVPVNSGISLARAMGIVDYKNPREDLHGLTEDDFLLATGAYEGTVVYPRWTDENGPYNFDVDDLDNTTDGLVPDPKGNAKVRATTETPLGGLSALRMPYIARSNKEGDTHGFDPPSPSRPFDINTFMVNQVSLFFVTRGKLTQEQLDQPCLQYLGSDDRSCDFMPLYSDIITSE